MEQQDKKSHRSIVAILIIVFGLCALLLGGDLLSGILGFTSIACSEEASDPSETAPSEDPFTES